MRELGEPHLRTVYDTSPQGFIRGLRSTTIGSRVHLSSERSRLAILVNQGATHGADQRVG